MGRIDKSVEKFQIIDVDPSHPSSTVWAMCSEFQRVQYGNGKRTPLLDKCDKHHHIQGIKVDIT